MLGYLCIFGYKWKRGSKQNLTLNDNILVTEWQESLSFCMWRSFISYTLLVEEAVEDETYFLVGLVLEGHLKIALKRTHVTPYKVPVETQCSDMPTVSDVRIMCLYWKTLLDTCWRWRCQHLPASCETWRCSSYVNRSQIVSIQTWSLPTSSFLSIMHPCWLFLLPIFWYMKLKTHTAYYSLSQVCIFCTCE